MASRIRELTIQPVRLTPTEAELAVEMRCPQPIPTTELRGRLMGPSCLYSTTVEVSHPIRSAGRHEHGSPVFRGRILIPEPAWWDPDSPFLYHGPVELWEHEHKVEVVRVRIGLRHAVWQDDRLIWNGLPVELKPKPAAEINDEAFRSLRQAGANAVNVEANELESACEIADRIGLIVFADDLHVVPAIQHPSAAPPRA
jgi:beta-galactosidase/beta-glucuronidase